MDREEDKAMQVVWRNPAPPFRVWRSIELVGLEPGTSIYVVSGSGPETVFKLIAGGAMDLVQEDSAQQACEQGW